MKENSFFVGDCLEAMKGLEEESISMVYLDPPYNTGRNFGEFDDKFGSMAEYAQGFLAPRIKECHRILKKDGNIIVHVEPKNSHYVRLVLDDVSSVRASILSGQLVFSRARTGIELVV